MENATKALLIAGSVLIAILIIAVGLRIFNSTQGTVESAQTTMNSTDVTMFNSQFTSYIGKNKTKNEVIQFTNKVIASNASSKHNITVNIFNNTTNVATDLMQAVNNLNDTAKYSINPSINSNGYIYHFDITSSN